MKKIILYILTITLLASCWSNNEDNIDNNSDNVSSTSEMNIQEDKKESEVVNKVVPKQILTRNDEKDILSDIEDKINKEKEEKEQETKLKENEIKNVVSSYFSAINSDNDIIKYLDVNSVLKIKKNTKLVFDSLTNKEKQDFITELQDYWYDEKTFNPDNSTQFNKYINFIVKWWFKSSWSIDKIEYNFFKFEEDYNLTNITVNYNEWITKKIDIILSKSNKINISN